MKRSSWTFTPERDIKNRVIVIGSNRFTCLYSKLGADTLEITGQCMKHLSELNTSFIIIEEPEPCELKEFKQNHSIPIVVSAPGWRTNRNNFNRCSHIEIYESD